MVPDDEDDDRANVGWESDVDNVDAAIIVRSYHVSNNGTSNHPTTMSNEISDISATLRIPSNIASCCCFDRRNFFRTVVKRCDNDTIVLRSINSSREWNTPPKNVEVLLPVDMLSQYCVCICVSVCVLLFKPNCVVFQIIGLYSRNKIG